MRFLCWFGIHDWVILNWRWGRGTLFKQICLRCGKQVDQIRQEKERQIRADLLENERFVKAKKMWVEE